jgi:filamentous hemagglutinin
LILNEANNAYKEKLNTKDLIIPGKTDSGMIKQVFNSALNYQKNTENTPVNYKILSPNCNTWFFNLSEINNIQNNTRGVGAFYVEPGAKKELDQNLWKENGGKSGR